jgi:hypothetical protein
MRYLLLMVASLVLSAPVVFATEIGVVNCPSDSNGGSFGFCTYTIKKNASKAQVIIAKVEQALFQGFPLTMPKGILAPFGENNSEIIFWHVESDTLEKMKQVIPLMDTYEDFRPDRVYNIKVEIHHMTQDALTNLSANITGLTLGNSGNAPVGVNNSGLELSLQLGAVELSALIQAERSKGTINTEYSNNKVITNLSTVEFDNATEIDYAPGAGTQPNIRKEGVQFDGVVSQSQGNPEIIQIKNLNFEYGIKREDGFIQRIHAPFDSFFLRDGVSTPIIVDKIFTRQREVNGSVTGVGANWGKKYTHFVAYVTVTSMDWDEYMDILEGVGEVGDSTFGEDEFNSLPDNCSKLFDVLKDIKLRATRDASGQPVLTFKINKDKACKSNISEIVKVNVSSFAIRNSSNTAMMPLEQLMLIPYRIRDIDPTKLEKPILKFKVTFRAKGLKVVHKLRYLPKAMNMEAAFFRD